MNTGGVLSFDQVIVRDAVEVFPQASVAIHILVLELIHPMVVTGSDPTVTGVTLPQLSVAVALPRLAFC